MICPGCEKPFEPAGRGRICSECLPLWRKRVLREKAVELRKKRCFREGVLMWKTWKLLCEFERKGVTQASFPTVLQALGLKADLVRISGRQIRDRKIVREKAARCGWFCLRKPAPRGCRLFLEKAAGSCPDGGALVYSEAWPKKT